MARANLRLIAVVTSATTALLAQLANAFPAPITADPATQYTAAAGVDYQNVQSFNRTIYFDTATLPTIYPKLYWFKYTSDGNSRVKFDTLGSDFGTNGPGDPSPGGPVLGSYNQSQIAVYRSNGTPVAVSKGSTGLDGNPIVQYPNYTSNSNRWYYSQGLSEVYFRPDAPTNPRWNVSPTDPTPYAGWAAPGNEGNSQKYFQPFYPTNLNEYQVWNTALSPVILDNNGQQVINPDTGLPRSQPGWRYFDRARVGPGSSWNRYSVLPAGDYYIAVSSAAPTFAGDGPTEEVLRAPIHFDYDTFQNNQRVLTAPLGTWQYYMPPASAQDYFGTIRLNVTTNPVIDPQWSLDGDGTWSAAGHWTGPIPTLPGSVAKFTSAIVADRTITLDSARTVGTLRFDNAHRYTLAGASTLTVTGEEGTGLISVASGSHTISAPLAYTTALQLDVQPAASVLSISNLQAGLQPIIKTGAGKAEVNLVNSYSLLVSAGTLKLTANQQASKVLGLSVGSAGTLDMGNAAMVIDYGGPTFLASPFASVKAALASGKITTTTLGRRVGYAEAASLGLAAFLNQSSIDATAVVLRSTFAGDCNLDGAVNFDDLLSLAQNYGAAGSAIWIQGDFNYDSAVNFDDLLELAQNYNSSLSVFESDWARAQSMVPEPTTLVSSVMFLAMTRRRRA